MLLTAALLSSAVAGDVDVFRPASSLPSGQGSLQGESPSIGLEGVSGSLSLGYSAEPVSRAFDDRPPVAEVVGLAPITAHVGYTVAERVRVDVMLPVYGWVDAPLTGYAGLAAGDARLQATLPLVDGGEGRPSFGLVPRLSVPTGSADALVDAGFGGQLIAAFGANTEDYGWLANAGFSAYRAQQLEAGAPAIGPTADGLISAWWHASSSMRVGGELDVALGLVRGDGAENANRTGTAHLFAQHVTEQGLGLTAGVGVGTLAGIGTPSSHGYVALSYARRAADADGDGIVDGSDACPREPEDADGFEDADGCPDVDNDGDGVLDVADRCPAAPEDRDGYADDDGCPDDDNDGDGLLDPADACPDQPGPATMSGCPDTDGDGLVDSVDVCPQEPGLPEFGGCPDRDADGVPDGRDACPDEPKPAAEDPATSDGCPKIAYVENGQVVILQKVEFETGKAVLLPSSTPILEAVLKVLQQNPQIIRIEVQGHTDNVGSPTYNEKLSGERAAAVRSWLTERGIAARKLAAKGYGESSPIDSNRTEAGRAVNRRVQFVILESVPPAAPSAPAPTPSAPAPSAPEATPDEPSPWGEAPADEPAPWGELPEE
jgi:outer membrane protein OmpA-like peptidoglycan-associated protein